MIFLILFLFTKSDTKNGTYTDISIAFYVDPLTMIMNLLAEHTVSILFLFSLIIVFLTLITGRTFCGWICPLGTLNDMVGSLKKRETEIVKISHFRVKYLILVFLITLSLFGVNLAGFLDPLSLTIRSFTIILYPALNISLHSMYEFLTGLFSGSEFLPRVYSFMKMYLIENYKVYFYQSIFIGSLFILILMANLILKRFWCRYICPLGALLGIISSFSFIRRRVTHCNECNVCKVNCNGGASIIDVKNAHISECVMCMNCSSMCPEESVKFKMAGERKNTSIDIGKRRVLISAGVGLVAYPLFRAAPVSSLGFISATLIRPPGARREDILLKNCIKCGACMKVCITNGLNPTLFKAGIQGMWTPYLIPKIGHCEYNCNLCSQVCPTGAIKPVTLSEKKNIKIGTAHINKNRCIAYKDAKGCLVCEEVCPVPEKAVKVENIQVQIDNEVRFVKAPRVVSSLCIGCGICEKNCPVVDMPAIYVTSVGESRSEENQELLE